MKKDNLHNVTTSGFKTPDNYFESLDDQILERLTEKEMISGSEASGFTVPKDYFDSVESTILGQLKTLPEKPVIILKSRSTFYYVAGIAASLLLLVSLIFNNSNDPLTIDALETASIESYLYQEDYSNDDLATLFITDDISDTDFIDVNITDENLNLYLENIDTEDLILY